jgi:hypothetical protein
LSHIITGKVTISEPGQTFSIDSEYGVENTVTAKFFVMHEDFVPASMDEMIMSGCQAIVSNK